MKAPCEGCPTAPSARTATRREKYLSYAAYRERIRQARRLDHDATTALIRGAEKIKREAIRRSKSKGL